MDPAGESRSGREVVQVHQQQRKPRRFPKEMLCLVSPVKMIPGKYRDSWVFFVGKSNGSLIRKMNEHNDDDDDDDDDELAVNLGS